MAPSTPACSRSGQSWVTWHRATTPPWETRRNWKDTGEAVWSLAGEELVITGTQRCKYHTARPGIPRSGSAQLGTRWNVLPAIFAIRRLWNPSTVGESAFYSNCCRHQTDKEPWLKALQRHLLVQQWYKTQKWPNLSEVGVDSCWVIVRAVEKSEKRLQAWSAQIDRIVFICQCTNHILFQISWERLINTMRQQLLMQPEPQTRWRARNISQGF